MVVVLDTCLRIIDIDTRANGQRTEFWVVLLLELCLVSYCLEFIANLFVHGRTFIQFSTSFLFDCTVVLTAILEIIVYAGFGKSFDDLGLRFLNIVRIGRVFRMFRVFVRFKELNKLRQDSLERD